MGTGSVMLVLLLIATTVKSNQNCAITDSLVDIQTNAKILQISPDEAPYKDGCCQVVKAAEVKKPESVKYSDAKADSSYVLLMLDPDAPSPAFLHWIIGNIKGSDLQHGTSFTSASNLLDYYEPSPPSSQHRYQFYLFEQKKEIEQVAEIQGKIKNHGRAPWTSEDIGKLLKSDLEVSSPAVAVFQYSAYTSDKPCSTENDCKKCS